MRTCSGDGPLRTCGASARPLRRGWPVTASGLSRTSSACRCASSVTRCQSSAGASKEELRGHSCLPPIVDIDRMREAVAAFAHHAGEKLREHGLVAGQMAVFIRTSEFRPGPRHANQVSFRIEPTADSMTLVAQATRAVDRIWREGYAYAKGGVMMTDLSYIGQRRGDLFPSRDPVVSAKLMSAMDTVNARFGRGGLRPAATGVNRGWTPRANRVSPRYTTSFEDALIVKTG